MDSIFDNGVAQVSVAHRIADEADGRGNGGQLPGDVLRQSLVSQGQKRLIRTHAPALSAHQNEARKHAEMVSLKNLIRSLLFASVVLPLAAYAENSGTRTTISVRADAHSGRLVRSVVVTPRAVSGPEAPEPIPAAETLPPVNASSLTEMIDTIAARNQVEASLVHSVIKAESNYNPVAISPAGAQGIMQLIPSTARRFGVSNSFNVQQNIEGGVKYLKFLIDLYHNDYRKVIAAYNAGEGAVAKYGGIPPYAETMTYVVRVAKNLKTARQVAELRAAERKITLPVAVTTIASAATAESQTHPIVAVTGEDGKVYYKTQ